ncbi:MAG: 3-oxoacyl-ACP reductase FabG [Oscillospiraceae bacterium]
MKKTALITGASKGIGSAIAIMLAKEGYIVGINYNSSNREAENVLNTIKKDGGEGYLYKCDIESSIDVANMISTVISDMGSVDVLVNNAGISQQKLFTDITDDDFDNMIGVNLTGAFYVTRAVLPLMISKKRGKIINISSMWGEIGGSCEVHYSASKAGLIGMTKALAKEVAPSGITVNAITPGVIETDMVKKLGADTMNMLKEEIPLGRIGTPVDIANAVSFLASEKADYITGEILSVSGGMVI